MPVTVLIFAKFARNKPATLLKYELLSDVLQTLNLDIETFFRKQLLLNNCLGISDRWVDDGLKVSLFPGLLEEDQHADNV